MGITPPAEPENYSRRHGLESDMFWWRAAVLLSVVALWLPAPARAQAANAYYEFLLGLRLEQEGDTRGAQAALERAAAADPASAEVRAELAAFHMRQHDADAAERAAREALE